MPDSQLHRNEPRHHGVPAAHGPLRNTSTDTEDTVSVAAAREDRQAEGRAATGTAKEQQTKRRKRTGLFETVNTTQLIIATLLAGGALYFCSRFFVPIAISLLAYLTLRPLVAKLCSIGLPQAVASGVVILTMFASVALIAVLLFAPIQKWLEQAPRSAEKIGRNLEMFSEPLTVVDRLEGKLENVSEEAEQGETDVEVSVDKPSLVDETVLVNTTGKVLAGVVAIAVLTFFMLSTGDDLLNRVLHLMPEEERRRQVVELTGEIQHAIGKYLCQITFINVGLGAAVTLAMWLIGMPTPLLWGTMATLFNFIPYVGALAGTAVVFVAAAASFDTVLQAFLTAVLFWSLTAVEGQFVTPAVLGKTLRVGPVVVLVAIAFWGFFWGLPGVFMAVPLLIVGRHIFARFDATYPLAVILGAEPNVTESIDEEVREDQPIAAAG